MTTLDSPGLCLRCGADAGGCEPDARHYGGDSCAHPAVFGTDEVLPMIR